MTDVKVEQCDRDAAHAVILRNLIAASGGEYPWMREALADILEGKEDEHYMVQAFAHHRQAAEKAQQERDAGIAGEWQSSLRPGSPERLAGHKEAASAIATAIRSQGHE